MHAGGLGNRTAAHADERGAVRQVCLRGKGFRENARAHSIFLYFRKIPSPSAIYLPRRTESCRPEKRGNPPCARAFHRSPCLAIEAAERPAVRCRAPPGKQPCTAYSGGSPKAWVRGAACTPAIPHLPSYVATPYMKILKENI